MEIITANDNTSKSHTLLSPEFCKNSLLISCNWQIVNNKQFCDAVTTVPLQDAPASINYEDVVSIETCIALQPVSPTINSCTEPCMLEIKMTNCQKIARVAVVSEGEVLEIFKQFGEYETTVFAEFIDECLENTVFFGDTTMQPPTAEFTRIKSKGPMWIYGIRLFLTDSVKEAKPSAFNYEIIQTFLSNNNDKPSKGAEMAKKVFNYYNKQEITNQECFKLEDLETFATNYLKCKNRIGKTDNEKENRNRAEDSEKSNSLECENETARRDGNEKERPNCGENSKNLDTDIRIYIDNKFHDMEMRLMRRIDEIESNTNQKLNAILERLKALNFK
ncbi:uncharacterized protein LOC109857690 isoform X2 [Pseudomyrmex gracilis]|uniref:uncharacterized protein LOC109857690 isoform X2 n=1 Tax=Pseudomyrmex gracilis TaxID=219809 RepID=UPI00099503AA|nr:uncharacterized protein LOC109857690 isoform X2 [Pseudomyrmex gracilis]